MLFLDFEASSLDADSYPVEVAWCSHDLKSGYSATIRPLDAWRPRFAWSDLSAKMHGLDLADLMATGTPAAAVARQVVGDLMRAPMIASDQPKHDRQWLDKLAEAAGLDAPGIADLGAMLAQRAARQHVSRPAVEQFATTWAEEIGLVPHRALDDVVMHALRLAVVTLAEIRTSHGDGAAGQAREVMTGRAQALISRWGRPAKEQ